MERMEYTPDAVLWFLNEGRNTFRENGPCIIHNQGTLCFSQLNPLNTNRKRGASIIRPNGEIIYKDYNGLTHRTDGPAIIYSNGSKDYAVNDQFMPASEFFLRYGVL